MHLVEICCFHTPVSVHFKESYDLAYHANQIFQSLSQCTLPMVLIQYMVL